MKRLSTLMAMFICLSSIVFSQADLVVSSAGFQPNSIDKGDIFSVQATVTNIGNVTAPANYMFVYFTQDLTVSIDEIISRVSIKSLAPNESQTIDFIYPVPSPLTSGDYFVALEVDPFEQIVELDEANLFCASNSSGCIPFTVSNSVLSSQKFTYPIIFVHGWTDNSITWNSFTDEADSFYGWSFGGRLDYCLNPDGDLSTSDGTALSFVTPSNLVIADYYYLNLDVNMFGAPFVSDDGISFNDDLSNQSAIVKQGLAVKDAVEKILNVTGAEKVILVGHSMGGLASREYIQNSNNWQSDGNHHIAKLFTIGTPNGGSNTTGAGLGIFLGNDENSEAIRDLRHDGFPFIFDAQYLFGGAEDNFSIYYNDDVDCNGFVGDIITGLNEKNSPNDISYSCMVSNYLFSGSDGVVDSDRADLNNYLFSPSPLSPPVADRYDVTSFHSDMHKDNHPFMIRGLDEPESFELAYTVPLNSLNFAFISEQASPAVDWDTYKFDVIENGSLELGIWNITVNTFSMFLYDENFLIIDDVQSNGGSNIEINSDLTAGTYYLKVGGIPTPNSFNFPYAYSILFTPAIPLVANFSSNLMEGCEPFSVNFSNQSTGDINNLEWTFEGGTPSSSTLENPTISYNTSGTYSVALTITDNFGNNTVTQNNFITVKALPQAEFTLNTQLDEVTFSNQTQFDIDAPTYLWDFGDSETSTEESPTHVYQNDGTYNIQLTATNSCGSTTFSQTINIMTVATEDLKVQSDISIFPNPSKDKLTLKIEGQTLGDYEISLINNVGQVIRHYSKSKIGNELEFEMNTFDLPSGTYFIRINSEREHQVMRVVKL